MLSRWERQHKYCWLLHWSLKGTLTDGLSTQQDIHLKSCMTSGYIINLDMRFHKSSGLLECKRYFHNCIFRLNILIGILGGTMVDWLYIALSLAMIFPSPPEKKISAAIWIFKTQNKPTIIFNASLLFFSGFFFF